MSIQQSKAGGRPGPLALVQRVQYPRPVRLSTKTSRDAGETSEVCHVSLDQTAPLRIDVPNTTTSGLHQRTWQVECTSLNGKSRQVVGLSSKAQADRVLESCAVGASKVHETHRGRAAAAHTRPSILYLGKDLSSSVSFMLLLRTL